MNQQLGMNKISRRTFVQMGAGIVSASLFIGGARVEADGQAAEVADSILPKSVLTPDQALAELVDGNQRFVASKRINPHQDFVRVKQTATSQAPIAAILSCADSRVVPEILFDQGIGDLFDVRVAGNIADTDSIASEEFAVAELGVPLVLVLGHERCGAVTAAVKGGSLPGVMNNLVYEISPAIATLKGRSGDFLTQAIQANVKMQVRKLQVSPVISEQVQQGKLKVVGGYYDLDTGSVKLLSA